jgi:dephospho-CoA kinase
MSSVPVIGLVGGIGSGKSAVSKILADLGCVVSDSDHLAHACLKDSGVISTLVDRWGTEILATDGTPDRSAIARIVFCEGSELAWLESVLHPMINRRRRLELDSLTNEASGFVIDAPLLFEAGIDSECDVIFFIDTPLGQRLERVMASRGWSKDDLIAREARQMSLNEKRDRATEVLSNDGSIEDLHGHVLKAFDRIRSLPPHTT